MTSASVLVNHWAMLESQLTRNLETFRAVAELSRLTFLQRTIANRTEDLRQQIRDARELRDSHPDWNTVTRIRNEVSGLHGECLSIMQGVAAAKSGIGNPICAVAQGLVTELSGKANVQDEHLVLLGQRNSFTDLSEVIRFDCVDGSVAALPIVAHEWGHYWARRWLEVFPAPREPYAVWAAKYDKHIPADHLNELFADFVGVFTIGAGFAYSCIFLHLLPTMAASQTHPSAKTRAAWILGLLKHTDPGRGRFLKGVWEDCAEERLDEAGSTYFDAADELLYSTRQTKRDLEFKTFGRAFRIQDQHALRTPDNIDLEDVTFVDLVNAYWLIREKQLGDPLLRQRAETTCGSLCARLAMLRGLLRGERWQTA